MTEQNKINNIHKHNQHHGTHGNNPIYLQTKQTTPKLHNNTRSNSNKTYTNKTNHHKT